jgi:glycosyltransferase involved in cell wall biosynthesis
MFEDSAFVHYTSRSDTLPSEAIVRGACRVKLMIQIPCFNEESTLEATLADLPREIEGIDQIEVLVIDDGSQDETLEVARRNGVDHILRFAQNRGLGHAFSSGMDYCLRHGADIIVNTDGDNQYAGADVVLLVQPLLEGRAELVIGDRGTENVEHFSPRKKWLQRVGSRVVSRLADLDVPDAASGFKAYSREAASMISMSTSFDHTVDHLIQAGRKKIPTASVPIRTNAKLRESRLFGSVYEFVGRSAETMVRVYSSYGALRVFASLGFVTFSLGVLLGIRFLYYFLFSETDHLHVQSLILAAILMLAGFQMVLTGIVADLINSSRSVLEDLSYRFRRMETPRADSSDRSRES